MHDRETIASPDTSTPTGRHEHLFIEERSFVGVTAPIILGLLVTWGLYVGNMLPGRTAEIDRPLRYGTVGRPKPRADENRSGCDSPDEDRAPPGGDSSASIQFDVDAAEYWRSGWSLIEPLRAEYARFCLEVARRLP